MKSRANLRPHGRGFEAAMSVNDLSHALSAYQGQPPVGVYQHRFRYHVSNARGWSDWSKWQDGPAAHPGTEFVKVEERVLFPIPVAPPETTLPTWVREKLAACKAAIDAYAEALERREHGGVAASRCVNAIEEVFYPERYQPVGAVRSTNQEN
ncbi:hypothetical protein ACTJKV_11245 [Agrobacterium sp. 22117]